MKKIGMILLALYLIVDSLLGFGLNIGPFIFLLYFVGLAPVFSSHRRYGEIRLSPQIRRKSREYRRAFRVCTSDFEIALFVVAR